MVDSIVESRNTVEAVTIYTETGVDSDMIEALQTYFQKHIDVDDERIEVFEDLALLQLATTLVYFKKVSVYREALQN